MSAPGPADDGPARASARAPAPLAVVLPRLLVLTDRTRTGGRPLVDVVTAALAGGARAIVLREKDLDRAERARLADQLRPLVHEHGGAFLVASDPTIDSDGVHLAAGDDYCGTGALDDPVIGRSCHDLDEVAAAGAEGCDYVTLSPIFTTDSKPGYGPALGPDVLADAPRPRAHGLALPVYALGGIDAAGAVRCLRAGFAGVAVLGAVMGADDPEAATRLLVHATDTLEVPGEAGSAAGDGAAGSTASAGSTRSNGPTVGSVTP